MYNLDLDDAVPFYVAHVGVWLGADICELGSFTTCAGEGTRVLKRHFSLSKVAEYHLVPYWARCLAEVLASSSVAPKEVLLRAKIDAEFRDAVRAALMLGGYVGLRDFLKSQGHIA